MKPAPVVLLSELPFETTLVGRLFLKMLPVRPPGLWLLLSRSLTDKPSFCGVLVVPKDCAWLSSSSGLTSGGANCCAERWFYCC